MLTKFLLTLFITKIRAFQYHADKMEIQEAIQNEIKSRIYL